MSQVAVRNAEARGQDPEKRGGSKKEGATRGGEGGKRTVKAVLKIGDGKGDPPRGRTVFRMRDEDACGRVLHYYRRPACFGHILPSQFLVLAD